MAKKKNLFVNKVNSGGRPQLILNENGKEAIEKLAMIHCTDEEISDFIGVSVDTLTNGNNKETFTECKKRGVSKGNVSLRRTQFQLAEKSAAMSIFLGKQYLGQRDNFEAETHLASDKDFEAMVKALRGETSENT